MRFENPFYLQPGVRTQKINALEPCSNRYLCLIWRPAPRRSRFDILRVYPGL
jgi:hypothetical protein